MDQFVVFEGQPIFYNEIDGWELGLGNIDDPDFE